MTYFIVNPYSSTRNGINIWKKIKTNLEYLNYEYIEIITGGKGSAEESVRKILAKNTAHELTFIVVGGDGTLNEVINGIDDMKRVILGYIPSGSSNDLARGLGLTTNTEEQLHRVLNHKNIVELDYGIARVNNTSRKFIVSAGIGFDGYVCYETNISKIKKLFNAIKAGKLTYTAIAVKSMFKQPYAEINACIDDKEQTFHKSLFLAAHNTPYEGGGFMFCPEASPFDHKLGVIVTSEITKIKALMIIPKAKKGRHIGVKGINITSGTSISVKTDIPLHIHTDGESYIISDNEGNQTNLHNHVSFECSKDTIKFIL